MNVFRKQKALSIAIALAYAGPGAFAQTAEPPVFPDMRIEVTGSRIARTDSETALPVQVISRDEILRGNFNTASELMAHISANVNGMNSQLSIGTSGNPGMASANLRGLGDGNTLVLLNGRRLSNYAFLSATVDLNSIPLAAIERVEILKDGASSIYGTDAIAGVINFITRKDFSGVEVSGQAGVTQHGGGDHYQATVTAGWGDLTKDRFNAFVTVDWQKGHAIVRDGPRIFLHGNSTRNRVGPREPANGTRQHSHPRSVRLHQSRVRRGVCAAGVRASRADTGVLANPVLRLRLVQRNRYLSAGRTMDSHRPGDLAVCAEPPAVRGVRLCSKPDAAERDTHSSVFFYHHRIHAGALPGDGSVLSGRVRRRERPVRAAKPALSNDSAGTARR
jgi:outer membrane receptor protein involved in Fe transport